MTLPTIAQLEIETGTPTTSETVHKTFAWDFDVGDFKLQDGKTIALTGIEYLKVWIQKALHTVRDSPIYEGTKYGSEHQSLIGRNFKPGFMHSEMERMIREALFENEAITEVENVTFAQNGERLEVSFQVNSIYGTTSEAVTV